MPCWVVTVSKCRFKEAQAVQPGKCLAPCRSAERRSALQRGPGRSAREIRNPRKRTLAVLRASKRPRPFSPGNWFERATSANQQYDASKRPRPFSPGNANAEFPALTRWVCFKEAQAVQPGKFASAPRNYHICHRLQRGPGRSAREMGLIAGRFLPPAYCFKEAQAVQPGKWLY